MFDYELTITTFLERATERFGHKEIVTKTGKDTLHRYTYADAYERIAQLAHALDDCGLDAGDRIATMAANHYRHYELYFGPACSERSVHTVNHRLPDEHLVHMINEAEDRLVFVDPAFLETVEGVADELETVERYVVLDDDVPETTLDPVVDYESFIADYPTEYDWPDIDEETEFGLCYTSGTTGMPKGVPYYHRKMFLHTLMHSHTDVFGISENDTVMPVVPMFHVNGWGLPYTATFCGSKLVLPGGHTSVDHIADLIDGESVSVAAAVPTVWIDMEKRLGDDEEGVLDSLKKTLIGGSSPPESLIRKYDNVYEAPIYQGYGMTEASPHLANTLMTTEAQSLPEDERYQLRMKPGIPAPGVRLELRDDDGEPVEQDGESKGEIHARAPWLIDEYYERPEATEAAFSEDGWFKTGDIGTIDEYGYLSVVDRVDDVIKSGGEWISSIELENELMGHDAVEEAVVISADHAKWQERPVAYVVIDGDATEDDLRDHLLQRFPKWWLPDQFIFVEDVPRTTTGKFDKVRLRESFAEEFGTLPTEE
ncbi:long-chain fatty acid--CoA ligase [Halogeometricum luteum]|uniref:Long-chain fatty acid--CoA ligase n=1 Tax=Halogeometricum luteum TaxID=2950537 RepID=A0ABU2G4L9_9EURY|nr:long-chain fatty acid--CoA ligase [Halogeometricum sp. S3BR5-2]MDS0295728.1 long-chain fatty acid--CoA ligase [Halogeometricum sp. S3BR5-2]